MSSKYVFGITKNYIGGKYRPQGVGICHCGQFVIKKNQERKFQCDSCGNDYFINASGQSGERFSIPYLEMIRKDNRGFKVKRINLSVKYIDGDSLSVVRENLSRTVDYDIVDKTLNVWRDDVLEYSYDRGDGYDQLSKSNQQLFRQLEPWDFIDRVSNEVTRSLYVVAKDLSNRGWGRSINMLNGFIRLMKEQSHLQILANAGIPNVKRFHSIYSHRTRDVIDKKANKPHRIIGLPKFMIKYIREDVTVDLFAIKSLQAGLKNVDGNKFREIMSIIKDESDLKTLSKSIGDVMQIHVDYGYDNLKKLVLYLFREVRLYQGINSPSEASTYLRDYIRMSQSMGLEWERYPKSLKKEHDVVLMNYNLLNNNERKQKEFRLAINKKSYKELEYIDKKSKYAIILPKETEDLVKEGNQLSHCVSSYVNDVSKDKCKILFLREQENIDKPLATIEVRGFNIRQARGFGNRSIDEEKREFISEWAEKNGLVEAYY